MSEHEIPPGQRPGWRGRSCVFVDETMMTPHGIVPSVVYENEPGHWPLSGKGAGSAPWYWGDLATARKIAADYNAKLGLSEDDARDIVLSSMRASR